MIVEKAKALRDKIPLGRPKTNVTPLRDNLFPIKIDEADHVSELNLITSYAKAIFGNQEELNFNMRESDLPYDKISIPVALYSPESGRIQTVNAMLTLRSGNRISLTYSPQSPENFTLKYLKNSYEAYTNDHHKLAMMQTLRKSLSTTLAQQKSNGRYK